MWVRFATRSRAATRYCRFFAWLTVVFLMTTFIVSPGIFTPLNEETKLPESNVLNVELEPSQKKMVHLYLEKLVFSLKQFARRSPNGLSPSPLPTEIGVARSNATMRTPETVLSSYYEKELLVRNNNMEKKLKDEYTDNVVYSKGYWSPIHVTRRGYGLEGSIFVAMLHQDVAKRRHQLKGIRIEGENARQSKRGAGSCAMTVYSMYERAKWPVALFTGIVEVVLDASQSEITEIGEWPSWMSQPLPNSPCVPEEYLSDACAASYDFCPRDNIRIRQIRLAHKTTSKDKNNWGNHRSTTDAEKKLDDPENRPFSSHAAQRYATLTLYRGETYVLFLRDGLLLTPHWDVLTRLKWLQLPSPRAVLTQMPENVNRALVRRAWAEVVIKGIEVISSRVEERIEKTSSLVKDSMKSSDTKGPTKWIHKVGWALDLKAVLLSDHTSERLEGKKEEGESSKSQTTDSANDPGLSEEEIVDYIFRTAATPSLGIRKDAQATKDPREPPSATRRRDIQMHWLQHFRKPLMEFLQSEMGKGETITYICGWKIKAPGPKLHHGFSAKMFSVKRKRLTHAMQDPRYMQPSLIHMCDMENVAACPNITSPTPKSNETLPLLPQRLVTTDFLFTRAEAFFAFQEKTRSHSRRKTTVQLDPYLSLLTSEEESVLLSARLWTHGWDFFSPTEPIVFNGARSVDVGHPRRQQHSKPGDVEALWSANTEHLRRQSVARLCFILFNGASGVRADDKALQHVDLYGLGTWRSWQMWSRFSGVEGLEWEKHGRKDRWKEWGEKDVLSMISEFAKKQDPHAGWCNDQHSI